MARLTIGVPVYNSETLLEQCLENLAAQSFRDFQVIVLDNASTDSSGDIAQRFAARDPRFTYRRQPKNVGARQNFTDVLEMAATPYFMWRADDDSSDVNFVEELVRLLDANPGAALAASRALMSKRGRQREKRFPMRAPFEPSALYSIRLLLRSRAPWLYGIFRTQDLRDSLARVNAAYTHLQGFDHLIMLPFLVDLRVVGTNDTAFVTGFVDRPTSARKRNLQHPRQMGIIRRDFLRYCRGEVARAVSPARAIILRPFLWLYLERVYRSLKVWHARIRIMMGEQPFGTATKYD